MISEFLQQIYHYIYPQFPELETEMVTYCGGAGQGSPDRLDALVWAITDLTENNSGVRFILA